MLVVIMLLAVVLTMVFFTISRVSPTQRVKAAATQLGSDFDELRHWAAVSGKKHAILYDLDAHRYALLIPRQVRSEEDRAQLEKSREEGEAETLELLAWHDFPSFLNNSVRITEVVFSRRDVRGSGQVRVEVSPKGTASGHYVRLASTEDDQAAFTIEINAVTGLVSYHEGFPDFDLVEDMPITE
ncbi:MAG: hypothetical protein HY719_13210 [Planctomycetes bacterium]|nr:hypothetical protein [Planctomycetota bacterium]